MSNTYIGVKPLVGSYIDTSSVVKIYKDTDVVWSKRLRLGSYLTFTADDTVTISKASVTWDGTLYYSTDARNWNEWDGTAVSGNPLYLGGIGNTVITNGIAMGLTGTNVVCTGNIESLLDANITARGGHPTASARAFDSLFYNRPSLIVAPTLGCVEVPEKGYYYMFSKCTGLTRSPRIYATRVNKYGCANMFWGCTSLRNISAIDTTWAGISSFSYCFEQTAMQNVPLLHFTYADRGACRHMIYGVQCRENYSADAPYAFRVPNVGLMDGEASGWGAYMFGDYSDIQVEGGTTYYINVPYQNA